MLQAHGSLKTIKKKLIRKALDMIRKIAEEDPDELSGKDEKGTLYLFLYDDLQFFLHGVMNVQT